MEDVDWSQFYGGAIVGEDEAMILGGAVVWLRLHALRLFE